MLAPEELKRREDFVINFRNSAAIEGLFPDESTRKLEDAYVAGDLTEEEYSNALAKLSGTAEYDHDAIKKLKESFERGEMPVDVFMAQFTELLGPKPRRMTP